MGSIIHTQSAGRDGAREEGCWSLIESYNSTTYAVIFTIFFCCFAASIHTTKSMPSSSPDGWSATLKGIYEWPLTPVAILQQQPWLLSHSLASQLLCWKDIDRQHTTAVSMCYHYAYSRPCRVSYERELLYVGNLSVRYRLCVFHMD